MTRLDTRHTQCPWRTFPSRWQADFYLVYRNHARVHITVCTITIASNSSLTGTPWFMIAAFLATSRATMMFPTRRKHGTGTTHTTRQAVHKGALHMTSTLSSPCNSGFRAIFVASPLFRCYLLSADFVNRSQHDDCIRISPPTNESQDQLSWQCHNFRATPD